MYTSEDSKVTMGRYSYNLPVRRGNMNNVTIGSFVSFGHLCVLDCGFNHNRKFVSTFPFNVAFTQCSHLTGHPLQPGDIKIGNDCWFGEECLIMAGIKVGDGAIIGARSIVTKDIPPYEVWAGSPAKFIRKRFTDEQIEKLLKLKWWDKELNEILAIAPMLMSENLDQLFSHYNL